METRTHPFCGFWEITAMVSKISTHLRDSAITPMADWAVLAVGVLMLTSAIVGTVVAPALDMQAEADMAVARENAAL
ncbi:MAG: hypothetical protein AAGH70_10435 [Pseudomonadota bacterium]